MGFSGLAFVLRRLTRVTEISEREEPMKVPGTLVPLLLLAGSLSLAAQEPAPAGASVESMEVGESIDVRVVNVEAVVTDRGGQRIKGLNPTDFRLLVDGKDVPIDYFTEIRGGTAVEVHGDAPASPVSGTVGRNLLIFVDQSYTIQAQLELGLRRLEEDLGRLAPGDQIALVAADREGHLKILTDWTSDAARLRAAIAQLRQEPTGGVHLRVALDSLENDRILRNLAETGNVWGENANLERPEVGQWWDNRLARQPRGLSTLERYVAAEDGRARIWADDAFGVSALAAMRAFSAAPGRKMMLLFSGGWPGGVEPQIIEAANLLGYSLYPVDVPGLQASAVPLDASKVGLAPEDANASYGFVTSDWERRVHYGFEVLARETGGKASLNGLREAALQQTLDDTETYYWLGFSPTWNADGKKHDIRLEVRKSGLRVRARRSYSDLSLRAQQALEAQSRRVIAAAGSVER
jgi:VWFA-related protein